jgi:Protein of unknown function (DUF2630)
VSSDEEVLATINELVDQEHELQSRSHEGEGLSEEDAQRIQRVEVQLDQCWDLLRQRRARRHAGRDPDEATVRDVDTVEHYRQ